MGVLFTMEFTASSSIPDPQQKRKNLSQWTYCERYFFQRAHIAVLKILNNIPVFPILVLLCQPLHELSDCFHQPRGYDSVAKEERSLISMNRHFLRKYNFLTPSSKWQDGNEVAASTLESPTRPCLHITELVTQAV